MTLLKDIIWGSMGVLGLLLICIGSVKYLLVRKRSEVNAFKMRYLKMIFAGCICAFGAVYVLHFPHSTNEVLSAPASPHYMGFFEK